MRKTFIVLASLSIIVACGSNSSSDKEKTDTSTNASTTDITQHPDYKAGLAIEAKSDCITCHRVEERLNGPSYREIANKYAGSDTAVEYLAEKIRTGGSGVWGEVKMLGHPDLSEDERKTLARYVLLRKK